MAPVIAFKANCTTEEEKEFLAAALFHIRQSSTGSLDGDIRKFSCEIHKCVLYRLVPLLCLSNFFSSDSLVVSLGLKSDLTEYKVPIKDLPKIVEKALGTSDVPEFEPIVRLMEGLYAK